MAMNKIFNPLLLALFFLSGCGETEVSWKNYHPEVKTRIESMISSKDCHGLQREFDAAYENSDAQRSRTGEGNSSLMSYIEEQKQAIGCYQR
jgi:hypothetical protein